MLDFGWPELLLIMAIAVLAIGPREIPAVMRALGRMVRKLQDIKFSLSRQFDEFISDADLEALQAEARQRVIGDEQAEQEDDLAYYDAPDEAEAKPDQGQRTEGDPRYD